MTVTTMVTEILTNAYFMWSLVILTIVYLYLNWKSNYWKRRGVNGPKSYPLIGTLWDHFFLSSSDIELKRYQKYGPVHGAMQGWIPILTIGEPELIKQIRITDFRYFMNHRSIFLPESLLGKSLADLSDSEWKRVRNILSPVFTTGKLKAMQRKLNRCVQSVLLRMEDAAADGREVDLKKAMMSYTMDTIAKCAFAMETDENQAHYIEFQRQAKDFMTFRVWRIISSLVIPFKIQDALNFGLVDKSVAHYFERVLKAVIKERKESNIKRNDFVKLLLDAELSKDEDGFSSEDAHKKLTDDEIMAQCILFFVVGYETTATLLQFTLYALAMNPKVQQTLFQEIRNCFKEKDTIDYDSLMNLSYFDAVINESLRLYTPVINFHHVCGDDYKLGDTGVTIEKGTIINLPYYAMHQDPKLFPDPCEFKPERFLPENRHQIQPYSFLPFGTGPRICIGMRFATLSARLMLANFVNLFEVMRTQNTATEPEYDGTFLGLTCKPLMVTFKKRKQHFSSTNDLNNNKIPNGVH